MNQERQDLEGGYQLLIYKSDLAGEGWKVWLNVTTDFDGMCIGAGETRDKAVEDAVRMLETIVERLQVPSPEATRKCQELNR